jgi:hypothetical protein
MAKAETNQPVDDFKFSSGVGSLPKYREGRVNAEQLIISPLNFRFDGENNEFGVDTTSLDELEIKVRSDGEILKHITVEKVAENKYAVLVGGRRTRVAKRILADPQASDALKKAMKNVPAFIYPEGVLNDEQRLFIVNDQDMKEFRFSELVALVFMLYGKELKWHEVAARVYRQWGRLTGKADKLNKIDSLPDQKAKLAEIKKWLRGTIDEVYGEAYRIGPKAMKALILEAMEKDKLILTARNSPKDTPAERLTVGPYVYLEQKRLDALRQAKAEDVAVGQWNSVAGGPKFNALWEKYHNEDYNPTEGSGRGATKKSLTRNALQELATKSAQSSFATKLFCLASGDEVEWKADDTSIALYEAKQKLYLAVAGQFKEGSEVKKILYQSFVNADYDGFKQWLVDSYGIKPPVVEPAAEEKPEESDEEDEESEDETEGDGRSKPGGNNPAGRAGKDETAS